jgi:hypothetical protein
LLVDRTFFFSQQLDSSRQRCSIMSGQSESHVTDIRSKSIYVLDVILRNELHLAYRTAIEPL